MGAVLPPSVTVLFPRWYTDAGQQNGLVGAMVISMRLSGLEDNVDATASGR